MHSVLTCLLQVLNWWGVRKSNEEKRHVIWKSIFIGYFISGTLMQNSLTVDSTRSMTMLLSFKCLHSLHNRFLLSHFYINIQEIGIKILKRFQKFLLSLTIAMYTKNFFYLSFPVWKNFRWLFDFSIFMSWLHPGHPVIFISCHLSFLHAVEYCALTDTSVIW